MEKSKRRQKSFIWCEVQLTLFSCLCFGELMRDSVKRRKPIFAASLLLVTTPMRLWPQRCAGYSRVNGQVLSSEGWTLALLTPFSLLKKESVTIRLSIKAGIQSISYKPIFSLSLSLFYFFLTFLLGELMLYSKDSCRCIPIFLAASFIAVFIIAERGKKFTQWQMDG